ncbi:MAG TPA: histidine kinase, partial [Ktedonobacter sp.]|nr:histidine kinase [Ktedonobacter sp.]
IFLLDASNETLVARSISDTALGKRQQAIGMDRLPLANGGRTVEVFLTGTPHFNNHVNEDADELLGVKDGLGIQSQIAVIFKVQTHHRGVVLAASESQDFFSPQDVRFLEAVARWVGIVVGRAELAARVKYEEIEPSWGQIGEEILTIMAHELRNYLRPLEGRLDLMRDRAMRDQREKDVQNAESCIHTLGLLSQSISDLLDIARINQGIFTINPQSMNLVEITREVVTKFDAKHIPIAVHTPVEVVFTADPDRLHQALEHMLSYATSQEPQPKEIIIDVSVETRTDGPWILLTVKQIGSVLPQQFENLFQRFVSKTQSTNLGLGLYLTNQIALAHQGTLAIDSQSSDEMWLTFAFPVEEEELVVSSMRMIFRQ